MNQVEFIEKCKIKHNDFFDYSKVEFTVLSKNIIIICPIHGEFSQRATLHLKGVSCKKCTCNLINSVRKEKKLNCYINKSNVKFNFKYDYSLIDKNNYKGVNSYVKIVCPIHGEFEQILYLHYNSNTGCPKCSNALPSSLQKGLKYYIDKSNMVHNFKYDYSLINESDFRTSHQKVKVRCKNNHIFEVTLKEHISHKSGCVLCNRPVNNLETFISASTLKHGNKYDYSKVNYVNQNTKVIIICKTHGEFTQKPTNHYHSKRGCPKCKTSRGEMVIDNILTYNEIKFEKNKTFSGCKDKNLLQFDFYLPDYNMIIEYDGIQHFKVIGRFGGISEFEKTVTHDKIKNEYCKSNNINLLRISYKENIINKMFANFLLKEDVSFYTKMC